MMAEVIVGVAGSGASLLAARWLLAGRLMALARSNAYQGVEQFVSQNVHTKTLPLAYRATNGKLLETIKASRKARAEVLERMRRARPATSQGPKPVPVMKKDLERVSVSFVENLKTCYVLKVQSLAVAQIAARFDDRHGFLDHAKPHLSAVEQHVVGLLDEAGVVDLAERVLESIPEVVRLFSDDVANSTAHNMSELMHFVDGINSVPGLISGVRDAFSEFQFLMDGEVSLGDSVRDGLLPSAARIMMTKIGIGLDIATGWVTFGGFTVVSTWLGSLIGQEVLKARLQEQLDALEFHRSIIRDRQRSALMAINKAVDALMAAFSAEVENCPDIGDEPALVRFVDEIHAGYMTGLATAVRQTADSMHEGLARAGGKTWLDRILSIDRPGEVAQLYWTAQRAIDSRLVGAAHAFAVAAETDAEDAVAFLQEHLIFGNPETRTALDQLDRVREAATANYAGRLTAWEGRCQDIWATGAKQVQHVTAQEHAATRDVLEREQRAMDEIRRKIAVLAKRLKLEPIR